MAYFNIALPALLYALGALYSIKRSKFLCILKRGIERQSVGRNPLDKMRRDHRNR